MLNVRFFRTCSLIAIALAAFGGRLAAAVDSNTAPIPLADAEQAASNAATTCGNNSKQGGVDCGDGGGTGGLVGGISPGSGTSSGSGTATSGSSTSGTTGDCPCNHPAVTTVSNGGTGTGGSSGGGGTGGLKDCAAVDQKQTDRNTDHAVNSYGKSFIDNSSFNHISTADDILPLPVAWGTLTGGPATGTILPGARLRRIHRFRNMTEHSSFGPGVFSCYDTSLDLMVMDSGAYLATVFDPQLRSALFLADTNDTNHTYKGIGGVNFVQSLYFYTSTGAHTGDPTAAKTAVLTMPDGITTTFELFDEKGGMPNSWVSSDIGGPQSWGSAGYANGVYSLTAAGDGYGATVDGFGFIYEKMQGDCTLVAQVNSLATYRGLAADGTDPNAEVGLAMRDGLGSTNATVHLSLTPGSGAIVESRPTLGGTLVRNAAVAGVPVASTWLKLNRTGNTITAFTSSTSTFPPTPIATVTVSGWSSAVYVGLSLSSHQGSVLSDATFTNVTMTGTTATLPWQTPPHANTNLVGRVTSWKDRNGYVETIAYKNTVGSVPTAPDKCWQIDTVTDAYGRVLTFSYNPAQVSGRWAVSSVANPNGSSVSYSYSGGLLSGINFPGSGGSTESTSSFTYTWNATTHCTVVSYDDSGQTGVHRRKKAYLTNVLQASINNRNPPQIYNQATNIIRIVVNGDNEVSYLNLISASSQNRQIYEGTGRMKQVRMLGTPPSTISAAAWVSWTMDPATGVVSGTVEGGSGNANFAKSVYTNDTLAMQGTASTTTDEQGIARTFTTYDSDGYPTVITYPDATTEKFTYNAFKEVTRYEDRLHRVTLMTYDPINNNGNLTMREFGIIFDGTNDVHQGEYGFTKWNYSPSSDPTYKFMLSSTVDANNNTTSYTYINAPGTPAHRRLATIVTPNDAGTGTITAWTFTYDAYGRLATSTDAVGRKLTYSYDVRDRVTKITYPDNSTEITVFGTGTDKNLIAKRKDRVGVLTEYTYDLTGRLTQTVVGQNTMSADGLTITPVDPAQAAAQSLIATTTYAYLAGTESVSSMTINGNTTEYTYDFRGRTLTTTRHPTPTVSLTTTNLYADNYLRQVTDAYSRKTYYVYDTASPPQRPYLTRVVRGLIPSDGLADYTAASTLARDPLPTNPKYLITDSTNDAEGQVTAQTDPRAIGSTTTYDSRGRVTSRVAASSDSTVSGRTDFLYDAQGNLTEQRSPRYFDTVGADPNGSGAARTTMTYTKRNLLQTRTEALGVTGVAGTDTFAYYDDGRQNTRTDARGYVWTTTWGVCCGRQQGALDPSVTLPGAGSPTQPARITRFSDAGDLAHEATVGNYASTTFPSIALPANQTDVADADTVDEATSCYDVRHRRTLRTVWLVKRGLVNANSPPIPGLGGVPASDGMSTTWRYDDNLTDAVGLSNPSDADSVAPYLTGTPALSFGAKAVGSAMVEINPVGEHRWTIFDGMGRVVRVIDGNGNATTYDYNNAFDPMASNLLQLSMFDARGQQWRRRVDAAGREQVVIDADNHQTQQGFDADGNLASVRDATTPVAIGYDALFDARNRRFKVTDTHADVTQWTFDRNGNVLTVKDAALKITTNTYDARDRKIQVIDRVAGTTQFGYDSASNLLTIRDADSVFIGNPNPSTSYTYDPRSLLITEFFRRDASIGGTAGDQRTYAYDGGRRLATRTDQAAVTTTYLYDLANRLTTRRYSDALPSSTSWDDTFVYDTASRLTSAVSGRYGTTVTRNYTVSSEKAGRLRSETLAVGAGTAPWSTVTYGYDVVNALTSIGYPTGSTSNRGYTGNDHLFSSADYAGVAVVSARAYDVAQRLTSTTYGNGLVETRTYRSDAQGVDNQIASIAIPSVTSFAYLYDPDKRKTSETAFASAENQTFGYDDEGRVTAWTRSTTDDQAWILSQVGDWKTTSSTKPTPYTDTRTHDAVHQVLTVTQPTSRTLNQDGKGNLTIDRTGQTFTWDDENRLTGAQSSSASPGYVYDALGRRVSKIVDNLETTFVSGGAQTLSEYTGNAWTSADIGTVGIAGTSTFTGGVATVAGAGADIGGTADAFRYVYRQLSGDGTIVVDVTAIGNTNALAKAGLMIRNDTTAGAANVLVAITPSSGILLQSRSTSGGATTTNATTTGTAPKWLRLTRAGNVFTAAWSSDAITWTNLSSTATVTMAANPVLVGLAVSSHTTAALCTSTFTGIQSTGKVWAVATPTVARSYVYGSYVDEPLCVINSVAPTGRFYYHSNGLYSVAALTDSTTPTPVVVERYRYDAYGNRTVLNGAGTTVRGVSSYGNQIGFTGRYHDDETGLVYFRARQYSPTLGRFVSRDPIGYHDGASLYRAYFVPRFLDPSGWTPCGHWVIRPAVITLNDDDAAAVGSPTVKGYEVDFEKEGCDCECDSVDVVQAIKGSWSKSAHIDTTDDEQSSQNRSSPPGHVPPAYLDHGASGTHGGYADSPGANLKSGSAKLEACAYCVKGGTRTKQLGCVHFEWTVKSKSFTVPGSGPHLDPAGVEDGRYVGSEDPGETWTNAFNAWTNSAGSAP